ncbi:MAG TPA: hypothetical protein VKV74_15305 [Bryobacteraceae bacterium]|nr:hypothetical protein [Bryobacteraceae bacterium]
MRPLERCPRCGAAPVGGECPAGCITDFPLAATTDPIQTEDWYVGDNGQVLETEDEELIPGQEPA